MPQQAKVASIEALDSFRSTLIVYLDKAGRTLDDVSAEVVRTRLWLQTDRRVFWEAEIRRRRNTLSQKQQELFSARLSNLRDSARGEQMAVEKAKRALDEAEAKLSLVKRWIRQYDSRVQPLARGVEKMRDVLLRHMAHGVSYLSQATTTLEAYAEIPSPNSAGGDTGHESNSGTS